ncbi:MAG TPA: helix-turn-helix domain-containing protein [Tepidisphaeraceae bacterium]|jgi:hypothetical protein|nr:helix-turn-helix domain-containing protein [Tepidisphaeraceae bacterium]
MAKMFYTLDEAKTALGKSEEEIKQYAREGRLREFRDGPRLMFKADQVEQLRSEISSGAGDQVDLGVSDSGGMIDLVDTTGASGTSITLADTNTGQSTGFALKSGTGAGTVKAKEDTALATDLGLSGTAGGIPSPAARTSGSGMSSGGSRAGINVFGADEIPGVVDPMAQTAITPSTQEINLESVGSGSGLLDLSRERDDTSLGAVLEEISPGASGAPASDTGIGGGVDLEAPGGGIDRAPLAPVYVQAYDPMAPAFGGLALGAAAFVLFGLFALIAGVEGTSPGALAWLRDPSRASNQLWFVLLGGLVTAIIFFVIGMLAGKARGGAR